MMVNRVVILQRSVPPYRRPFFEQLRSNLRSRNIDLDLVVGDVDRPGGGVVSTPEWATVRHTRRVDLLGAEVHWQSLLSDVRGADLVVAEQSARSAHIQVLLAAPRPLRPPVALWGHGENLQHSTANRIGEWVKAATLKRADWFFAYTPTIGERLVSSGFPQDRLTALRNTVDVVPLAAAVDSHRHSDNHDLVKELGLKSDSVGLFVGRLYPLKRPLFLLDAAKSVRALVPDFELIVIGDGPEKDEFRRRSSNLSWVHMLTNANGLEIAPALAASTVMMLPGMIGLAAVDAIVSGLPTIAVAGQQHSPEFEYLENDGNAVILPSDIDPETYGQRTAELLLDRLRYDRLRENCLAERDRYSLDTFVDAFANGVQEATDAGCRP